VGSGVGAVASVRWVGDPPGTRRGPARRPGRGAPGRQCTGPRRAPLPRPAARGGGREGAGRCV